MPYSRNRIFFPCLWLDYKSDTKYERRTGWSLVNVFTRAVWPMRDPLFSRDSSYLTVSYDRDYLRQQRLSLLSTSGQHSIWKQQKEFFFNFWKSSIFCLDSQFLKSFLPLIFKKWDNHNNRKKQMTGKRRAVDGAHWSVHGYRRGGIM